MTSSPPDDARPLVGSPRRRTLLSVWLAAHVIVVGLWLIPAKVTPGLHKLLGPYMRTLHIRQSWAMFGNPGTPDYFLVTEGLDAQGEVVWGLADDVPDGHIRTRWDPLRKARRRLSKKSPERADAWMQWACRQAPPQVVGVRMVRVNQTYPSLDEYQQGAMGAQSETRKELRSLQCP